MTSPGKALTKDFGCIGGVDVDPEDDTIYISNSHMGFAKKMKFLVSITREIWLVP